MFSNATYYLLFEETNKNHKWTIFCDDDQYLEDRTLRLKDKLCYMKNKLKIQY